MPARLHKSRSRFDLTLRSDQTTPLYLTFDRDPKRPYTIPWRYAPNQPGVPTEVQEWYWQNGKRGAGISIETPESYANGGSEYGEWVWLRRLGAAQPAGQLYNVPLPMGTAALTSGQLDSAAVYGNDLFVTTRRQYVVRIPFCSPAGIVTEIDTGAGSITAGIAVWQYGGAGYLEVGRTGQPIYEYNGSTWTAGAAGTERAWLETPYWTIGSNLATGGAAGASGGSAQRLVGTDTNGTGFYHVAGDPKVAANWSSLYRIGPGTPTMPINRTVADNRTVWYATGMGCYGVDGLGYSPNLLKWVEQSAGTTNGQTVAFWDGLIWYGHESGLVAFAPDGSRIDFGTFLNFGARTGKLPIFGRPQVLAPSPEGLLVGYYNASNTTGYVGILLKDPDGGYRWSMAESVHAGQIPTFLRQQADTNGQPWLWIGTANATTGALKLYAQYLPRYGGDPEMDTLNSGQFLAATDWSIRLSRFNGHAGVPKALRRFAVEADYLGASYPDNTVDVGVAIDGASTFTSQGTATSSPRWTGTPAAAQVAAVSCQVKLTVHNTATHPVVLNSVAVRYHEQPEKIAFRTYKIMIGEGQQSPEDPWALHSRLERLQQGDVFVVEDEFGRTVEMLLESYEPTLEEQAPGKGWTLHADLTLSTTRQAVRYDSGALYNAGEALA